MEFRVLGWPPDGPTLRLDYRQFAYAGKFVMTATGKAVVRETSGTETADREETEFEDGVLGAVAFNEDRTDPATLWLRYVTVRSDRRGEGIGPRLLRFMSDRGLECGYDRIRIAVNNPFAYEAVHKAGFGWNGETTGIAELVCDRPEDRKKRYGAGFRRFLDGERELSESERSFVSEKLAAAEPPPVVSDP
ncbi:MAG: GNAT family N-acetyltransferase [Natronomonas sp.]